MTTTSRSTIFVLAAFAVAACGAADAPDDGARAVPPAVLPADSAAITPVAQDSGALRAGVDPGAGVQGGGSQAGAQAGAPPVERAAERTQPQGSGAATPAAPAAAQTAPPSSTRDDAAAVLLRAAAAYGNVRSLRADFVMTREIPALRQTITSRGTLYQRSPDRVALRFSEPAGDVILSDGEYFWVYYPSVNPQQVMRQPATEGGRSGVDLQAQFVGNPTERFDATLHGTETVGARQAHVLTLIPRQRAEYRSLKVWLDARDSLARRFEIVEHNGSIRRFDLEDLRTNVSIPDATFRFTPPAGARILSGG